MPRRAPELSAQAVAKLRDDGDYMVGGVPGLLLRVSGASRHWCLRYSLNGARRLMGLGAFPTVTLAQARELARQARSQVTMGVDPIDSRTKVQQAAREAARAAMTFDAAAAAYIATREAEWKNPKHRDQWENTIAQYASPVMGRLDVSAIEQAQVLRVLDPIWRTKTETAVRLRGRIETILDWCTVQGRRSGPNPARWRGHLDQLLPNPKRVAKRGHHRAIEWADAPSAYARISQVPGLGAQALCLLVLTAVRSGELRLATWEEFDLDAALWTIPAKRMKVKNQGDHRVPLSAQALKLLRGLPRFDGESLVFPSSRTLRPLSDMTLTAVMRRLHFDAVPHGWRSTFRDWAAESTSFPSEVAEKALAHAVKNQVEAAYRRGDLLAKRVDLMQAWADYLAPPDLFTQP